LNQILKRQTSRFHYGSKVPAETLCFVFFKLLGTELSNIYSNITHAGKIAISEQIFSDFE
jgi:hypothetical protein